MSSDISSDQMKNIINTIVNEIKLYTDELTPAKNVVIRKIAYLIFKHGRGICFASYKTIAAMADVSRKTVERTVKMLRELGFLSVKRSIQNDGVRRGTNIITFSGEFKTRPTLKEKAKKALDTVFKLFGLSVNESVNESEEIAPPMNRDKSMQMSPLSISIRENISNQGNINNDISIKGSNRLINI